MEWTLSERFRPVIEEILLRQVDGYISQRDLEDECHCMIPMQAYMCKAGALERVEGGGYAVNVGLLSNYVDIQKVEDERYRRSSVGNWGAISSLI